MSLNFQKAEYQGFPMRYITFLWDNYFRRYLAKTVELLFTVRILNCPTVSTPVPNVRSFTLRGPLCAPRLQGRGGKMFRPVQSKITKISNKLNILASFLTRCDQWHLYMNARKIEFLSLELILLVKLKSISVEQADLKLLKLQF